MCRTKLNLGDLTVRNHAGPSSTPPANMPRRQPGRTGHALSFMASLAALALAGSGTQVMAQPLPTGSHVVAGSGSISQSGSTLTVTQGSALLATDWQTFSVGAGSTVNFVQPSASSVALNRVLGADVSVIQGALNANGQVFLINPNGVLFTPTAQVNVGGLVASTLNLATADFMAGNYRFEGSSASTGAVVNQGNIKAHGDAGRGGTIALIAARISNTGALTAERGNVLLGAGSKVTLDLGGPVKLQVEQGAIDALIEQGGAIRADGGLVYLSAKATGGLMTTAINHAGVTEAQTLTSGEKGQIYLLADRDTNRIVVDGMLDASAPNGGAGGFIETSAAQVQVAEGSRVTTLAPAGRTGLWLIDPVDFTISAGSGGQTTAGIGAATLATSLNTTDVTIQTDGSTGGNGNIFVNANVTKTAAGTTSLTLKAHGDIVLASNVGISSTGGALNVTLNSDSDSSLSGAIKLGQNASIVTRGGNIIMGGGSDPLNTPAYANASASIASGISLDSTNVVLDAGGGNISLNGRTRWFSSGGVAANNQAQIKTTGNGSITIVGNGGNNGYGVGLDRTTISAQNGAINITGTTASTSQYAVVQRVGNKIESTGSGAINITGNGPLGIYLGAWGVPTMLGGNSATGNISLTTNKLTISDAGYIVKSTGSLSIKPYTAGTSIGIGSGAGALQLNSAYFSTNFANGFSGITIGDAAAGNVTVDGAISTPDALTVRSGGNITLNAASSLSSSQPAGALVLAADGNFTNNAGANALRTTDAGTSDRWLVYSRDPASNVSGGLVSGTTPVWGQTFASQAPASVAAGNRYVFAVADPAAPVPVVPVPVAPIPVVPVAVATSPAAPLDVAAPPASTATSVQELAAIQAIQSGASRRPDRPDPALTNQQLLASGLARLVIVDGGILQRDGVPLAE